MYDLQCPLCSNLEHAAFVRTGAVVRCAACSGKYRIKASHVTRKVTTGPKTLDEVDPLVAGDGVDLDSDEDASPVKINDDGHVVGLSGLTELMQQTDARQARKDRDETHQPVPYPPPPAGKLKRSASEPKQSPATASPPQPGRAQPQTSPQKDGLTTARERAQRRARLRRRKTNMLIAGGMLAGGLMVLAVVMLLRPTEPPPVRDTADARVPAGVQPADPANLNNPDQATDPEPGETTQEPSDTGQTVPDLFDAKYTYSPNPNSQYISDDSTSLDAPVEVPAVLTKPETLSHEGWYILSPPRGFADAAGDRSDIELSQLERVSLNPLGNCVLQGKLTNRGEMAAVSGEVHIALLDPAGRVFAETYLPFSLLPAGDSMTVNLPIDERFWERARDQRIHVTQASLLNELKPIPGVSLSQIGQGSYAAVRVSVRNPREQWIKDTVLVLTAYDINAQPIARYRVVQNDLFIAPDDWLDMVVHTPLPASPAGPYRWSATLHAPIGE